MAKKAVATLHEGSTDGRAYTKVIKMVKSPKTGAYMFDERIVANEAVRISSRSKNSKNLHIGSVLVRKDRHTFFCFCTRGVVGLFMVGCVAAAGRHSLLIWHYIIEIQSVIEG